MREPDFVIYTRHHEVYLNRWWVIPRNPWFNIYLHQFKQSDEPICHDHPWYSIGVLLKGVLKEVVLTEYDPPRERGVVRNLTRWVPVFRKPKTAHRLILHSKEAWTLFFTGPVVRDWGFYTEKGWVMHEEYDSGTYGVKRQNGNA